MKKSVLALWAVSAAISAQATINVGSSAFSYSQNFDGLASSGTANAWVNDSTLVGWSLFNFSESPITAYAADSGSSTTGGFRSQGNSSDRALGGLGSGGTYFGSPPAGSIAGWIAVAFTNATGGALAGFTLGFDGEQWRNGGNATAHTMVLEYGFGTNFSAVNWATPGGTFDWTSPVTGTTAAAVDGNSAGLVAGLGGNIATPWAAGDTLWVRWTERNEFGSDHAMAIDNLSLTVAAVPEPETYAMLLAGLAVLGGVARRRRA